ncbi:MAG: endonuclease/exonuclease/phosphatase family protein [Lewinella sp.]
MLILRIIAYLIGGFGIIGTLMPFLSYDDFWIRGFDYPRQQLIFVLALAAALWLFTNVDWDRYDYVIGAVLILATCYQSYRIAPYTPLWEKQSLQAQQPVTKDTRLTLMVCNVLQTNKAYDKVTDLALDVSPDLLLTVETNKDWEVALHKALNDEYPYRVNVPLENLYGMHLFSRIPLQNPTIKYRIKDDIPSIDATISLGNGEEIDLYFLHPMPPSPTEDYASTGRDAELAMVGMEVKEKNRNAIVAGDMNDVAWSHSSRLFQRLSGLLDPRRGRGLYATFHADYWLARWPLDHIFHSTDLALVELKRLKGVGSDHFPVVITFNFEPNVSAEQEKDRKEGDVEEAKQVIEHGKADKKDVIIKQDE